MRVVVSNPSSNPEMAYAASALARQGALASYHVPIALQHDAVRAVERLRWGTAPFVREARRRRLPDAVPMSAVRRAATGSDLLRVFATRAQAPAAAQSGIAERHRRRFDAAVASRLTYAEDKVIAVQGSALATFRRAHDLGIEALLDATLAHPKLVQGLIDQEMAASGGARAELGVELLPRGFTERRVAELTLADRVLVPSSFAYRSYLAEGIAPGRIEILPLGVDTDAFTPSPGVERESAGVPSPPHRQSASDAVFRVLFVGRLTRLKGVPYLIDAFSKAALPNAELLLVGDTAFIDPSWLETPGIRHQPPIPRYVLPSVFRSADIFVMPSLVESYGLVLLEAMASGVPVVATANSIGPDAVEDGVSGYVVPARDSDALAERIVMLAGDPALRHKMGKAAAFAAKRFTWSAYEANLIAALGR